MSEHEFARRWFTDEQIDERRINAVKLRAQGYTYWDIGKKLGVSHAQARADVMAVLSRNALAHPEGVEEMRAREVERLDWLTQQLYERGTLDDDGMAVFIKISHLRSRLLGLEAPRRTTITIDQEQDRKMSPDQILLRMAELQKRLAEMKQDVGMLEPGTPADLEAQALPEVVLAKESGSEKD